MLSNPCKNFLPFHSLRFLLCKGLQFYEFTIDNFHELLHDILSIITLIFYSKIVIHQRGSIMLSQWARSIISTKVNPKQHCLYLNLNF